MALTLKEGNSLFCEGLFWDSNLTWNTAVPDFTPCFQDCLLLILPCFVFWLTAVISLSINRKQTANIPSPWTPLIILKLVFCAALICLCCVEIGFISYYHHHGHHDLDSSFYASCIQVATYVLVLIITLKNRFTGRRTSTLLTLFWLSMTICGIVIFRSMLLRTSDDYLPPLPKYKFILEMIYFPLVCCQFLLSVIPDKLVASHLEVQSPFDNCSFFSFLTFYWFFGVISKGKKQLLTVGDFPSLPKKMNANYTWKAFNSNWCKEMKNIKVTDNESRAKSPRIAWIIIKTFWPWFLASTAFQLIYAFSLTIPPLLLQELLKFISRSNDYMWKGYLISIALFICDNFAKLCINFMLYYSASFALQFKNAVTSAIYRKSMRLSNMARRDYTTGEIVNIVSVDVDKVFAFVSFFSFVIGSPTKVVLSVILLWIYLGPSCLSGIAVILLMIFLTTFVSKRVNALQVKQMDTKDLRLKFMTEILNGIKVLKLYAWEIPFTTKISDIREEEVNLIRSFKIFYALFSFVWRSAAFLVALASFTTYILVSESHILNPVTVFVSLNVLNTLRYAVAEVPTLISNIIQTSVSLKRIVGFLTADERDEKEIGCTPDSGESISMRNVTLSWSLNEEPNLKDIDFHVSKGSLVAVIGPVGSGKSSLLSAILGEMYKKSGSIDMEGKVGYVPQQAWILNQTVRENVIFIHPMDKKKYDIVLDCCCLKPDLEILPAGDNTEIGEKGVNLSGGQKQRVSLARAVYNDADIYLLDDPLSAVDANVGKHIFENVIGKNGLLKNKSRVLVTHNIYVLSEADLIVTMEDGMIKEMGTYEELIGHQQLFAKLIKEYANVAKNDSPEDVAEYEEIVGDGPSLVSRSISKPSVDRTVSVDSNSRADANGGRLGEEELMEVGEVKRTVITAYAKLMGLKFLILIFIGYLCYEACEVGGNAWLSKWSQDPEPTNGSYDFALRNERLGIYAALGAGQITFIILGSVSLAYGATAAAKQLHQGMLHSIMRAPMLFFDTTPLGRILNRFSRDTGDIDTAIPQEIDVVIYFIFATLGTVVIISVTTPIFIPFLIPIVSCYYVIQRIYLKVSRQLKRLSATTRSPIYSHLTESIQGASSINAYQVQDVFIRNYEHKLNINTNCEFMGHTCTRWFDINLAGISDSIVLLSSLLAVIYKDHLDAAAVGLSVSYALSVTDVLSFLIRNGTELENKAVAIERVNEYSNLESEAPWKTSDTFPPGDWPTLGQIEFKNYSTRYRENLDLVLRDLNVKIFENEKVGIVGRTGAGKSSFSLALFRMIEPVIGTINIDDIDVSNIGLHQLRSKLTIIPQDPTLFTGTLRSNLDPNNEYTDNDVLLSLEHANMKNFVSSRPEGLLCDIAEGGSNLSVGQRQLICLARALLKKTKILILDEATAAIDVETDRYIQETIRSEFKSHTVITIAHRLNTIMDYDRVLVMDGGKISEMGKPSDLLQDKNSRFYEMAKDAGLF